jgi:hypothetical protein
MNRALVSIDSTLGPGRLLTVRQCMVVRSRVAAWVSGRFGGFLVRMCGCVLSVRVTI